MTLWKIGKVALVRAADVTIAKAKLADATENPTWLQAEIEIIRATGPEEIILLAGNAPESTKSKRTKRTTE